MPPLAVREHVFEYGLLPALQGIRWDARLCADVAAALRKAEGPRSADLFRAQAWLQVARKALKLSEDLARLVLETYKTVTPTPLPPSGHYPIPEFVLFLFLQSYSKSLLRGPHLTIGESYPTSPNSPGGSPTAQALRTVSEDQTKQSAFVKSHLGEILQLVSSASAAAQPRVGALTRAQFDVLSLYLEATGAGADKLSDQTPFFRDGPVSMAEALEWLTSSIQVNPTASPGMATALRMADPAPGGDSATTDLLWLSPKQGLIFNQHKRTVVKAGADICRSSLRINSCTKSFIYVLAAVPYVTISNCRNATIVIGVAEHAINVEDCEHVTIICVGRQLRIRNSSECVFHVHCSTSPVLMGGNHMLKFGPYNTFYGGLDEHMRMAGIDASGQHWRCPLDLGSAAAAVHSPSKAPKKIAGEDQASVTMEPGEFSPFVIPFVTSGNTTCNPIPLPAEYAFAVESKLGVVHRLRASVKEVNMDAQTQHQLQGFIESQFQEWLVSSGNMRQIHDIVAQY